MNFRQKSKLKGEWAFVKYKGDAAIYAVCQNCGFTYHSSYNPKPTKERPHPAPQPLKPKYKYCPNCGLKMHLFNGEEVYKIDRYPWEPQE